MRAGKGFDKMLHSALSGLIMAGLTPHTPIPSEIKLHQQTRELEISFDDGQQFRLSCEYLRVFSPSAEVRGHSPDQATLQTGKKHVAIVDIQPVGNYAVKLVFDDGHDSGLYSWDYLYQLGRNQQANWQDYLAQLARAGASRE
jgi:DUF971 family protein